MGVGKVMVLVRWNFSFVFFLVTILMSSFFVFSHDTIYTNESSLDRKSVV